VGIAISIFLCAASAVLFFRLSKLAPYFITALFAFGLIKLIFYWPGLPSSEWAVGGVIGQLLSLCIVVYAWHSQLQDRLLDIQTGAGKVALLPADGLEARPSVAHGRLYAA
jgi:hypothetical protein